jgi:hypothetical protein
MQLSDLMTQQLEAWVTADPTPESPRAIRWGGVWHCPADGSRMNESDGVISCDTCGRHLPPRFIFPLVEFHQHEKHP